jgi:hypothetical protein
MYTISYVYCLLYLTMVFNSICYTAVKLCLHLTIYTVFNKWWATFIYMRTNFKTSKLCTSSRPVDNNITDHGENTVSNSSSTAICLQHCSLAMTASTQSTILALQLLCDIAPSLRLLILSRHTVISPSPRRHDDCDHPCKWHFNATLELTLLPVCEDRNLESGQCSNSTNM